MSQIGKFLFRIYLIYRNVLKEKSNIIEEKVLKNKYDM